MARLQRTSRGTIILPNKERITVAEQKTLINAVRRANRVRTSEIRRTTELNKGNPKQYNRFGVESDFYLRKKSASFTKFRSKNEYRRYLTSTLRQASGATSLHRIKTYRSNFETSLRKVFNSKANDAIKLLRKIDNQKLRDAVESGKLEDIGYVYYDQADDKLLLIEQQLEQLAN